MKAAQEAGTKGGAPLELEEEVGSSDRKPSGGQTTNGEPRAEVSQATKWKPGADVGWIGNRTRKAGAGRADDGERKDPGTGDA